MGGISISDDVPLGLNRSVLRGELNRYRNVANHMGTQWTAPLQFEISFIKSPCEYPNQADMIFTEYEINLIAAWLTSPDYPVLLKMYDEDLETFTKYNYYGVFSDLTPQIIAGDICGFTATFDTDSPFAWNIPDAVIGHGVNNFERRIELNVNTAELYREVYPIITIEPDNTDQLSRIDIKLRNYTDNGRTLNLSLTKTKTVIDCRRAMIYNEFGLISFDDMGLSDVDYIYWPRLFNGKNTFYITGAATVTFEWREPRKVGAA